VGQGINRLSPSSKHFATSSAFHPFSFSLLLSSSLLHPSLKPPIMQKVMQNGVEQIKQTATNALDYANTGHLKTQSAKIKDLERDMREVTTDQPITTDFGQRVANTDNWLKIASDKQTGPHLLEDHINREKIHRFDHERIPERVVHARGAAAHGKFTLHKSMEEYSFAPVLTDTTRETPVFLRFSTVQGSRGSADTVRDVRGFAVKFYTQEGNWDIVGNNIPVFFIQESAKFPDFVHAVKPEPHNEVPQAQSAHNNHWDFTFLHKEATHMVQWQMSDRTIPRSYRMMQGFGVNTYSLINGKGERNFVKFIFTPELGVHSLVWDEALKLAGQDPDFHRKDLYEAIDNGAFPKWKFGVQVIKEEDEHKFEFDILDATKVWPEELVPIEYFGELELNRNVDEYFTQTEQVAFCTSHIVPGIDFSDDPLLQGRNFSYQDTQLSRLGINWQELPINRPVCPVLNNNRDGQGRHTITKGTVNYWPNRFSANPPADGQEGRPKGGFVSYPQKASGIKARMLSEKFKEHFSQAQTFYNSMSEIEKMHMLNAYSFEIDHCDDPLVYESWPQHLADVDLDLAQSVAKNVGAPTPTKASRPNHGKKAKGLSQMEFLPSPEVGIKTRRIAILIGNDFDEVSYKHILQAVKDAQAVPFTIGSHRQPVKASGGNFEAKPDHFFKGMRSTMFDALFIPDGAHAETLKKDGLVRFWVREAFGHNKAIGAIGKGIQLVEAATSEAQGITLASQTSDGVTESYGVVTMGRQPEDSAKVEGATKEFVDTFFKQIAMHRCWQRELDGLSDMVAC